MAEHPKSKSTGGFYQADVSPCIKARATDRLTFCEVDVRGPVLRPVGRLEVPDESLHAVLGGRDEVDGLHGRQRFAFLVDSFNDGK